jgi:hypothetical protein
MRVETDIGVLPINQLNTKVNKKQASSWPVLLF